MNLTDYGKWSGVAFHESLVALSPSGDTNESNIEWLADNLREEGDYDSFKEAFILFLRDESMTFSQKGDLYLDGMTSGAKAWDYFKWIWEHFAPGEPWPLEGQERPKD